MGVSRVRTGQSRVHSRRISGKIGRRGLSPPLFCAFLLFLGAACAPCLTEPAICQTDDKDKPEIYMYDRISVTRRHKDLHKRRSCGNDGHQGPGCLTGGEAGTARSPKEELRKEGSSFFFCAAAKKRPYPNGTAVSIHRDPGGYPNGRYLRMREAKRSSLRPFPKSPASGSSA